MSMALISDFPWISISLRILLAPLIVRATTGRYEMRFLRRNILCFS